MNQALTYARRMPELAGKVAALEGLLPHVEPQERPAVLAEALQAARSLKEEGQRAAALSGLILHVPAQQRGGVLAESGCRGGDFGGRGAERVRHRRIRRLTWRKSCQTGQPMNVDSCSRVRSSIPQR